MLGAREQLGAGPRGFRDAQLLAARSTAPEKVWSGGAPGCSARGGAAECPGAPPGGRRALRSARWITGRRKPENLAPAPALAVTVSADVLCRRGARKGRPGNMRPA